MVKNDIRENIKSVYQNFLRVKFFGWMAGVAVILLAGRLFYLQVIKGAYYAKLAESNSVTFVRESAPRGYIYDRNYRAIVTNSPAYSAGIIPYYFKTNNKMEKVIREIADVLEIEPSEIEEKMKESGVHVFEPIILRRALTLKQLSELTEKTVEVNGITVLQEPQRQYPYGSLASHVIGYTGEITANQIKNTKYKGYRPGDIIGQTGIENYYDKILRGKDGLVYIITDAMGRQKKIAEKVESQQGKNIVLTIDFRLQKYAEQLMENTDFNGVIIAIEPKTGDILCMVSKPGYDLNNFSGRINAKYWKKILRDKANPLNNRAIQGLYSPGSIYKIVTGSGALNENIVKTDDAFFCEGIYWIKTWPYKCWKRTGHGWVSFYKAIEQSCDIYFYKVSLKMTVELLYKYSVMFGLGQKSGIDLPGEKSGLVPTREWKRRISRTPWFPGNTVMMAIGQGYITSTPLQILNIMAAMANGGYAMQPRLLKAVTMDNRRIFMNPEPKKLFEIEVKKENIKIMQAALKRVVNNWAGTGKASQVRGIEVAGKTGTVQNVHGDNHAMFSCYAPFENPEIAVYVLLEHGGGGGEAAAPIAGDLLDFYFRTLKEL
ncbi:MAG: penicillin-binding protein 2 [Candidatus Goldbacteria bacterium]|nr:penicillin-binding protein 2 [Candidatus Goldiibacteriota bacterium]